MKKHSKFISITLIVILTLSLFLMPVSAALAPLTYGDVNSNGIDIMDATYVQRYIAQLENHNPYKFVAGDVDGDGNLSVFDATLIQKYVAKEIDSFPAGEYEYIDLYIDGIGSSYGSGKAQVGVPVTFSGVAHGFLKPFVYNFYVDGELVVADTTEHTFTYTFETAGVHSVGFSVKNRAGICASEYIDFKVGDAITPDGSLVIRNLFHYTFYGNGGTFVVVAHGGKGEYMYSYALYEGSYSPDDYSGFIEEIPFIPYKIGNENYNTFTISRDFMPGNHYSLVVTVMDENGETATEVLEFDYELPPPA